MQAILGRGLGDEGSIDLHAVVLRNLGLVHLELADLSAIAAEQVHEFLFIVAPIPVKGASGSPVNQLAVV